MAVSTSTVQCQDCLRNQTKGTAPRGGGSSETFTGPQVTARRKGDVERLADLRRANALLQESNWSQTGTPELRARKMRLLCGFLQTKINPLGG